MQDGRPAQPAMSNQQLLAELLSIACGGYVGGHSSEIAKVRAVFTRKHQRHQSRPWIANGNSELPRQIVAEGSRTNLRYGQAAGRYHQRRRAKFGFRSSNDKLRRPSYFANLL